MAGRYRFRRIATLGEILGGGRRDRPPVATAPEVHYCVRRRADWYRASPHRGGLRRGPSRWPPVSPCSLSIDSTETARDPLLWLRGDRIASGPFARAPRDQWSVHKHP
jgi:hypothetical protein